MLGYKSLDAVNNCSIRITNDYILTADYLLVSVASTLTTRYST